LIKGIINTDRLDKLVWDIAKFVEGIFWFSTRKCFNMFFKLIGQYLWTNFRSGISVASRGNINKNGAEEGEGGGVEGGGTGS